MWLGMHPITLNPVSNFTTHVEHVFILRFFTFLIRYKDMLLCSYSENTFYVQMNMTYNVFRVVVHVLQTLLLLVCEIQFPKWASTGVFNPNWRILRKWNLYNTLVTNVGLQIVFMCGPMIPVI